MKKFFSRMTFFVVLLLVGVLLLSPFFRMTLKADGVLGESSLFLERMEADVATDMTVMFTPSATFNDEANVREFRIIFPGTGDGVWCLQDNATLTITGVDSSAIDQGAESAWDIDNALQDFGVENELTATCHQGAQNDYIEVVNIGTLTGTQSYGFKLDAAEAVFKTGAAGQHLISYQLEEDGVIENLTFGIVLLASDQVSVTAEVLDVDTITCTVGADIILPNLFPGGVYVTGSHGLSTDASGAGYYWTVYGEGDGATEAGLFLSGDNLLSSQHPSGTINLLTGEGFGIEFSGTPSVTPETNYNSATNGGTGIFGQVTRDPILILQSPNPGEHSYTITVGARAASNRPAGIYTETLTYVCGSYVGVPEVCQPDTCITLGYECGTHDDGCGGEFNCGDCPPGQVCAGGLCVEEECLPDTCGTLGYECGTHDDGCGGVIDCGDCVYTDDCINGVCHQIYAGIGEECWSNEDCAPNPYTGDFTLVCWDSLCKIPAGDVCMYDEECTGVGCDIDGSFCW